MMNVIKINKDEICDYQIPYNEPIKKEVDNIQKLIDACRQKFIENTGIPKDKIKL